MRRPDEAALGLSQRMVREPVIAEVGVQAALLDRWRGSDGGAADRTCIPTRLLTMVHPLALDHFRSTPSEEARRALPLRGSIAAGQGDSGTGPRDAATSRGGAIVDARVPADGPQPLR